MNMAKLLGKTVKMALHSKSEVLSNIKQNSKQILLHSVLRRNLTKVWKTWAGLLLGPKFYKIRNTINNFQKLNFKSEVYLFLKNKSLYSIHFIAKGGFLEPHSWLENVRNSKKKMLEQAKHIFDTFVYF